MNDKNTNTVSIRHTDTIITKESREQFVENIKNWVILDSQMKIINEKQQVDIYGNGTRNRKQYEFNNTCKE